MSAVSQNISNWNLFWTRESTQQTQNRERIMTRVYICFCIICTGSLLTYSGLYGKSMTVTVENVSQSIYTELYNLHPDTSECSCSNTIIPYGRFIMEMNAEFHPICSSKFITDTFIEDFNQGLSYFYVSLPVEDFRQWGTLFFRYLASGCKLAKSTTSDAITQFKSRSFISSEVITFLSFHAQINNFIQSFQSTLNLQYIRLIQLYRAHLQVNQFISIFNFNYNAYYNPNETESRLMLQPKAYENNTCSCATTATCFRKTFFAFRNKTIRYNLENIYISCNTLNAILLSSLQCFFSNSCIADFITSYCTDMPCYNRENTSFSRSSPLSAMTHMAENSAFSINDTIEKITSRYFIDYWSHNISYEQYFNACSPKYCTYKIQQKWDPIFMLTTFLGIYHGVCVILRISIRLLTTFFYRIQIFFSQNF